MRARKLSQNKKSEDWLKKIEKDEEGLFPQPDKIVSVKDNKSDKWLKKIENEGDD